MTKTERKIGESLVVRMSTLCGKARKASQDTATT